MSELLVRFVTQVEKLRVPPQPVALPASLDREALSAVVAHLLGRPGDLQLEFFAPSSGDNGTVPPGNRVLLRGALASFASSLGVSAEAVLTLEYAPAVLPPKTGPSFKTDDWISALCGSER